MKKAWETKVVRSDWTSLAKILDKVSQGETPHKMLQDIAKDFAVNEDKLDKIKKAPGMEWQGKEWQNFTEILNKAAEGKSFGHELQTAAEDLSWKIRETHGITAEQMHLAGFVKTAMKKKKRQQKNKPFTGGRDIMKKLVKKLRKEQGLPVIKRKPGYISDGYGIMQKLVKHTPPEKAEGLSDKFDTMQQVKKHPVKIKKSLDPLETYPPRPIAR